ncbi:E3 ubiquitin protein ligase RIN2 [Camellia lanceoleosa]|uniref:E3 ubiquitin protein ligase RIN2 n=1 Tax=Camellia lanceoleosa TaxID=1840588 RepID=A0ACC0GZ72_9ERIC|nr:E3 ubiquitin protein ligase RIN2 [Camellia lanceoleosa]
MGVSYLSISAVCTLLSFVGLQYWTELSLEKLKSDGLVGGHSVESVNARHALQLLFGSQATIALLANFALNVFVLLILGLKGTFLPMIVPPTVFRPVVNMVDYPLFIKDVPSFG